MQRLDREGATKKDDWSGDNEREARGEHLAKQRKGDTFAQVSVSRSFEDTHLQTKNAHLRATCTFFGGLKPLYCDYFLSTKYSTKLHSYHRKFVTLSSLSAPEQATCGTCGRGNCWVFWGWKDGRWGWTDKKKIVLCATVRFLFPLPVPVRVIVQTKRPGLFQKGSTGS